MNFNDKLQKALEGHSKVAIASCVILLWVSVIVMLALVIFGLAIISIILLDNIFYLHKDKTGNEIIIEIFHGLELIFLSPIPYLLMLSLTKYIYATKPELNPSDLIAKKQYMNHSFFELTNVKILNVGIFISLIIIHSITLLLKNAIIIDSVISISILLTVLFLYYYLLHKAAESLKNK